jgi:hypothetical protein
LNRLRRDLVVRQLFPALVVLAGVLVAVCTNVLVRQVLLNRRRLLSGAVLGDFGLLYRADGTLNLGFRIEDRFVGVDLVRVQTCSDADFEIADAEIRRKGTPNGILDLGADRLFQGGKLARRDIVGVVSRQEQGALRVHHGDLLDLHPGNRGRDQMADGLSGGAVVGRACLDDHGGRGSLLLPAERPSVRKDEVHAGGLDAVHALDGSCELALQCANLRDLLHEGGQTQ